MTTVLGNIGRYQIQGEVGSGSSGLVYECFDPVLKRQVAVKVPSLDLQGDSLQSVIQDFYHEAEIGARFKHTNLVTVYDVGCDLLRSEQQVESERCHYLVMELVDGINLKDYLLENKQLSIEETLKIIFECCKAIDYIHFHKILHRDIKPSNIIYDSVSNTVKITDFSISDDEDNPSAKQVGTLPYSAPEHFLSDRVLNKQTDIFALGSVMYQLLTGECPFLGSSVDEVASRIV